MVRPPHLSRSASPWTLQITQIFFPRSIENEILAHESGIRSRGFFGSRQQLTFVSQEQEIFGTYDLEDAQFDCKAVSPTLSSAPLPLLPSKARRAGTLPPSLQSPSLQSPSSEPQQQQLQRELSDSVHLAPNRRAPSPSCNETHVTIKPRFEKRLSINVSRFNNPALQSMKAKPSTRQIGACFEPRSQARQERFS